MKKVCPKCKIEKDVEDFGIYLRNKDGRLNQCRICRSAYNKENRKNGKSKISSKRYYENHKEQIFKWRQSYAKQYRAKNIEKMSAYDKEYYQQNKSKITAKKKHLRHTDPHANLIHTLRSRLNAVLKTKKSKNGSAVRDLGCSIQEFKQYLETKFKDGMSWDNRGQWHIDHIKPLVTFDLSKKEDFEKAVHFTNLQPLWAKENLSKGALAL